MRERIFGAAVELLRSEGLRGLSMRAVASHGSVSLGAIQFHFGNQRSFAREVLRWWGARISCLLEESARGALGLARTWSLCQSWIGLPDAGLIPLVAGTPRSPGEEREVGRATLLELMDGWISETLRSLRQAELRGELKQNVDLRASALDLHRTVWSHSWSSPLLGAAASANGILAACWHQLSLIAVGEAHLPPRPSPSTVLPLADREPELDPADEPAWTYLLERTEPLFHAFLRHEIMGDPRTFFRPPEVLPQDEAEAERYRARGEGGAGAPLPWPAS
jgi:AcrR family transcriptional regulator